MMILFVLSLGKGGELDMSDEQQKNHFYKKFILGTVVTIFVMCFLTSALQGGHPLYGFTRFQQHSFRCVVDEVRSGDWGDDCPSYPFVTVVADDGRVECFQMDYISNIEDIVHRNSSYTFVYSVGVTDGCASRYYSYYDLIRIEDSQGRWVWGGLF